MIKQENHRCPKMGLGWGIAYLLAGLGFVHPIWHDLLDVAATTVGGVIIAFAIEDLLANVRWKKAGKALPEMPWSDGPMLGFVVLAAIWFWVV